MMLRFVVLREISQNYVRVRNAMYLKGDVLRSHVIMTIFGRKPIIAH